MTDEPDNTPLDEDVTDNVTLSEDDTSDDFDYFDPDEDQDNEEAEAPDETDDEADEAEAEDGEDGQEAEDDQIEADPDAVTVTMDDGTTVDVKELKSGYLRQSDYTRKSQEVANDRKAIEANAQRMERTTQLFADHLSKLVPDAPDPNLLYTNPDDYLVKQEIHKRAMEQVEQLIKMGEEPKELAGSMSKEALAKAQHDANAELIQMFPEAAGGESRAKFMGNIAKAATDLGFSNEELSGNTDPRFFALGHWAQKGMEAAKAKETAKAKVAKAPPSTPRKPGQGARKPSGNASAMQKLAKSGSLQDAMAVDWD